MNTISSNYNATLVSSTITNFTPYPSIIGQSLIGNQIGLGAFPKIIQYSILIIAFDTLSTIPFARLRQDGRPIKFAIVKITGITINMLLTWFFISKSTGAGNAARGTKWAGSLVNLRARTSIFRLRRRMSSKSRQIPTLRGLQRRRTLKMLLLWRTLRER